MGPQLRLHGGGGWDRQAAPASTTCPQRPPAPGPPHSSPHSGRSPCCRPALTTRPLLWLFPLLRPLPHWGQADSAPFSRPQVKHHFPGRFPCRIRLGQPRDGLAAQLSHQDPGLSSLNTACPRVCLCLHSPEWWPELKPSQLYSRWQDGKWDKEERGHRVLIRLPFGTVLRCHLTLLLIPLVNT